MKMDLVMLLKITHNLVALDFCSFFGLTNYNGTRGHTITNLLNLYVVRYRTSVDRISKLEFASHNINRYAAACQVDLGTGALLLELLQCRDVRKRCLMINSKRAIVVRLKGNKVPRILHI